MVPEGRSENHKSPPARRPEAIAVAIQLVEPLTAIQINALIGVRLLASGAPDVERLHLSLRRTLRDCDRAASMLKLLHGLLSVN